MLELIYEINSLPIKIRIFGIIIYSIAIPLCFYLYFKLQKKRNRNDLR